MKRISKFVVFLVMLAASAMVFGQETTGTISGTVKDPSGAAIPGARVTVSTPNLVGRKTIVSDGRGTYHFENLPPGLYTVTVEAKGFSTRKQENFLLEVGHSPSLDLSLSVGAEATIVDVDSASAPAIDVTSVTTQTNVTQDVIDYVPRGVSYQSVIQFAPSARNEPLMGNTLLSNGSGSTSPGNGSNGLSYGYSVAGGSDAENSYLVEGQETANLIGGYSHTNVPFDFIQEVNVTTSGVQAEHGGALGGVVNVIMKKGSPHLHGSLFTQYEQNAMDAGPNSVTVYNGNSSEVATGWTSTSGHAYTGFTDAAYQAFKPKQDHTSYFAPGFTLGGPFAQFLPKMLNIPKSWDDKLFFFVGFNPEMTRDERFVDFGTISGCTANPPTQNNCFDNGVVPFSQNTNTYYSTARIDAQVTKNIRVFGSWLYQLQRQNGESLPGRDSVYGYNYNTRAGQYNISTSNQSTVYAHTLGYVAPNTTVNTGADITVTQHIVSTTRFGYYFENYHDFGFPTGGVEYQSINNSAATGEKDANGILLTVSAPTLALLANGSTSAPVNSNFTHFNSNKAIQLDETVSFYKSGWLGVHNFKVGYQLNRLSNYILQGYNQAYFQVSAGFDGTTDYQPQNDLGTNKTCPALKAGLGNGQCQGTYGYVDVYDAGNGGKAISYNHSLFAQDSWTLGKGVTINAGVRVEKEFLPGEAVVGNAPAHPINFGWGDKVAPRIGAAWDVFRNGKAKVFGDYGKFYDQMKLNLAISSFGGQYWNECIYALNEPTLSNIVPQYDANNRDCSGFVDTQTANFAGGIQPTGLSFIENVNYRAFPTTCSTCAASQEGVAPGLKPYEQHESEFGVDYQLTKALSFEARWDRRRLDHVIEDASIYNPAVGETFVVINPGEGVNASFENFCNFLYPASQGFTQCTSSTGAYPPDKNIRPARSYDGIEFRLTKAISNHWAGLFSYTYSHFRGNYTGLTSSDQADAGGGRNAPNNSRAFDEPYFEYNSLGGSDGGNLPTDRPNTFKGYAYYTLPYLHKLESTFGLFQTMYQGTPNTTLLDTGAGGGGWLVDSFSRGKWANASQNLGTGAITVGSPYIYRTPWYIQSDFQFQENYKITASKALSFSATFTNLLNEHTVTSVVETLDSTYSSNYIRPGNLNVTGGVPFYSAVEHPYNVQQLLNGTDAGSHENNKYGPITLSNLYGKPNTIQAGRTIRLQATFTF